MRDVASADGAGRKLCVMKELKLQYFQLIVRHPMLALPSLRHIIAALDLPACRSLAASLLAFLTQEQIATIAEAAAYSKKPHFFLHLVRNGHFLAQYLNRTDKSLYFPFYGEQQYKRIEIAQTAAIAQQQSAVFLEYHRDYDAVFAQLRPSLPNEAEEVDILRNLLADPDLPLPKLKRETQGMFCSSPFQLFLVDCAFREEEDEEPSCFQQFREFLSLEREEQYLKQFIAILKEKSLASNQLRKIMKVRYTPYQVTAKNMQDFLIQSNELHNFIVGLFALTDVMVQSTHAFISLITDPLHRLVELLLRYSIFRNYVLAVEDYLSFAFRIYENIYHDSIQQDPKKPKYKFWRPALTKWFLRMQHLHGQGTEVYMHCLTKLRDRKNCENLRELCSQDQLRYGKILNRAELNPFHCQLAQRIYDGHCSASSELAHYFDANPDSYEVLVMEFNEYLIDISVNEQTVHWCGHSGHHLEQPYLAYEQRLLEVNQEYLRSWLQEVGEEERSEVIRMDIEYLSLLQVKNRTLKKVVALVNQDLCSQHQLVFDFDEADHKLEYFNQKALILAQVDQNERPFYSIPPLCSPDKLIDMLDTNDSSSNNSEEDNYEYHSEQQAQRQLSTPFVNEVSEEPHKEPAGRKPVVKKFFAEDLGGAAGEEAL